MALLVMQAVGGFRAYVCDCGGQVTWTNVDHCHGPHSADCHDHEPAIPHHHDGESGDREDHEQIVQELKLRSVQGFHVPAIIPVLLSWMPDTFGFVGAWGGSLIRKPLIEIDPDASPPPGVTVARTVVFII
jgi:hypothetical protein